MKKNYEKPMVEYVDFDLEEILTVDLGDDPSTGMGAGNLGGDIE